MTIVVRKPRVAIRAGLPPAAIYTAVLQALAVWSDQQADAFAGDAAYAITREELLTIARRYVELVEVPSA